MARDPIPDDLPERQFTGFLADFFEADDRVVVGIGDDAAVLRCGPGDLVACCDPVVQGQHFDATAPLRAVGRKVVARNVSDLAAMGARPDSLLVSVLLPRGLDRARRLELFEGIREEAASYSMNVVGGDIGSTDGPMTITVTALGHVRSRPLRRSGARVGDTIWVSGHLGGSLVSGRPDRLPRHLRIAPRVREGLALAEGEFCRSAIDISDGLVVDLFTLCHASGVPGALLFADWIPIHDDAHLAARTSGESALHHALFDGEDHELLITTSGIPHRRIPDQLALTNARRALPSGFHPIGVMAAEAGLLLESPDGRKKRLPLRGFQHGGEDPEADD